MSFPPHIWSQLKNLTADELIRALEKDGWCYVVTRGAIRTYRHPDGTVVTIHYHPRKTYGPKLLRGLLRHIGWTEEDLKRLKLVK